MKSSPVLRAGLIVFAAVAASAEMTVTQAHPTYIVIDPPGANHEYGSGTWAMAVNKNVQVAGQFMTTKQDHWKGFLRNPDGSYVVFTGPNAWDTYVAALNERGDIAGAYSTTYNHEDAHGFIRSADGTITAFDAPGSGNYTSVTDMSEKGTVVGWFSDRVNPTSSFVRARNGHFTRVDVPGAFSTRICGINDFDQIGGYFQDQNQVLHGFVREADGTFDLFDLPSQDFAPISRCLDAAGNFAGEYTKTEDHTIHGFIRKSDGTLASLDHPRSTSTLVYGVNQNGIVFGASVPAGKTKKGFTYTPNGTFRNVKPLPDWAGADARDASPNGKHVVGYYHTSGVWYGFLYTR